MSKFLSPIRQWIWLALASGFLTGCATVPSTSSGDALRISEAGIGPVRLGMTASQVTAKLESQYRVVAPAANPSLEIAAWHRVLNSEQKELLRFLVRDWRRAGSASPIVQIRTVDSRFRTASGIGPGSSVAATQKKWGAPTLEMTAGGLNAERIRFAQQPSYLALMVQGEGGIPAGIYPPVTAETFLQDHRTTRFTPGSRILTVTVSRSAVTPRRASRATVPPATAPPMRARVSALRLD